MYAYAVYICKMYNACWLESSCSLGKSTLLVLEILNVVPLDQSSRVVKFHNLASSTKKPTMITTSCFDQADTTNTTNIYQHLPIQSNPRVSLKLSFPRKSVLVFPHVSFAPRSKAPKILSPAVSTANTAAGAASDAAAPGILRSRS